MTISPNEEWVRIARLDEADHIHFLTLLAEHHPDFPHAPSHRLGVSLPAYQPEA